MDTQPEETNEELLEEALKQPNGSGPAPKRRGRLTPAQKRAKLQAELRAIEEAEAEERARVARTPEGRMNNLENAVGNLAQGMAEMMAMMRQGPPPAIRQATPQEMAPPSFSGPNQDKVIRWWTQAQPLLRQCWILAMNPSADPHAVQSALGAVAELYANAYRNIAGEEPTTSFQPSQRKLDLNPVFAGKPNAADDASEARLWRGG